MKIGFRAAVKKEPGYRNTFDLSPVFEGRTIGAESGCGQILVERYGEFQRFVTGQGIPGRDPVEVQSDNPYIMVDATNSDETHWRGSTYTLSGRRTYCVSYQHLNHWRCQDGTMSSEGRLEGFGTNARGYDLPK